MSHLFRSRWLKLLAIFALCACTDGEPGGTAAPNLNPQYDHRDDDERGVPRPDIRLLAKLKSGHARPAAVVSETIGPEGGSLRAGDFEIIVPRGAVNRATRFSIRLPADPTGADYAWADFDATHSFSRVFIRLPRANTDSEPGARVLWWNTKTGKWVVQNTRQLGDGRIEAEVDHFSIYGTEWTGWFKGVSPMGG